MRQAGPTRVTLAALGLLVGLVPLSVWLADRPLAEFAHRHFHGIRAFVWLTWIAEPVLPAAALLLAGAALAAGFGWRPGRTARILLAAALAALVAAAIKDQLKLAFGRTWPETWTGGNPSWIQDHVEGFFPFHGGPGWASFPSGHMTMIAAPMAVFWRSVPRLRWLWAGAVLLVAIGLLGADYHYLGDILAGTGLGAVAGLALGPLIAAPIPPVPGGEGNYLWPMQTTGGLHTFEMGEQHWIGSLPSQSNRGFSHARLLSATPPGSSPG